jgi:hypothetical protein
MILHDKVLFAGLNSAENYGLELNHFDSEGIIARRLAEALGKIAQRWRRDINLRDERVGPFDPGDCSGAGSGAEYCAAVPEVAGGNTAQAAIPARVEVGCLH